MESEKVKFNPAAEFAEGLDTKPWLNKQKLGSVIPKKRKSVKRMVFERLAQFFVQVFCPNGSSSSGASSFPSKTCCCFNNGEMKGLCAHGGSFCWVMGAAAVVWVPAPPIEWVWLYTCTVPRLWPNSYSIDEAAHVIKNEGMKVTATTISGNAIEFELDDSFLGGYGGINDGFHKRADHNTHTSTDGATHVIKNEGMKVIATNISGNVIEFELDDFFLGGYGGINDGSIIELIIIFISTWM
nr:hypothetical protein CFP56_39439 [Quercus suber]